MRRPQTSSSLGNGRSSAKQRLLTGSSTKKGGFLRQCLVGAAEEDRCSSSHRRAFRLPFQPGCAAFSPRAVPTHSLPRGLPVLPSTASHELKKGKVRRQQRLSLDAGWREPSRVSKYLQIAADSTGFSTFCSGAVHSGTQPTRLRRRSLLCFPRFLTQNAGVSFCLRKLNFKLLWQNVAIQVPAASETDCAQQQHGKERTDPALAAA